jgi:UDP-N-acetylmuramate dehydrogenase
VFKNPADIGLAAGKLLDRAGAKGRRRGDAQVSCKHANFIINQGHARADDIRLLIDELDVLVRRSYGVQLEREIQFVGEW